MSQFKKGYQQVMEGIIGGIIVATLLQALAQDGLIPTSFVWLFVVVGIAANIITIDSYRIAGTVYTIGWITGAVILKDVLDPVDFIFYIVIPSIILAFRAWQVIQKYWGFFR